MASRHQFHLRWSNYGQNLATSFLRLFETESLSDVTLFCEGESYRAHRVVLAASSVHFQELFEQCSTAQNLVVILDGTSAANLRALLEFMYKGEVYIEDANLNTFLQTAKRLQVKGLSLSQNDLQTISRDGGDDRPDTKLPTFNSSSTQQDTILAQALGPILIPQQQMQQPPPNNKQLNSVQSPPNSFSSPSPSRTPPSMHAPSGLYSDEKMRKKMRMPSPRHTSPNGTISDTMDYGPTHHPPRTSAPPPSPSMNARLMAMDIDHRDSGRPGIPGGFPPFGAHYSPSLHPPGPQHSQQQQTVVITENPNIRKIRSISSENVMPEDLSIKLEVGREEEVSGVVMSGKQRSFSMDLSPSEPLFGGLGGGSGPSNSWSLPSPSSGTGQQSQQHHPQASPNNAQTSADGKSGKKLKCPFCERLYGYETNLRAHIRQRHQGIRVPCPFCSRTFTRNNTVRRHVAREHRALLGGVRFHPQLGGEPGGPPFGSPPTCSAASSPSQGSPSTSTSASSSSGTNVGLGGIVNTSGGSMVSGGGPMNIPHGMNMGGLGGPSQSSGGLGSGPPNMASHTPPLQSNNRSTSGSSGALGSGKSME